MPMIGSFYAPGEWVQPNQRNIGDSLLDLYKMKRQIEQDRMAAEESRMALETKKLAMQDALERTKQEREGQKAFAELMKGQQVQKPVVTPGSVIGGLTKGAGMLGNMYLDAMRGSFPQVPSLSTTQTVQEPVNLKDPAIQARLVQILASMPSKQGVLDDAIRAAMAPESRALTFEQQMEKEQFRANLRTSIEASKAQLARDLQDNKFTQQGRLEAQKRYEAFNYASQLIAQNIDGRIVLAHMNSIFNAPIVQGRVNRVDMMGVRRVNPETGAPEFIPLQPVGASSAPMPSPAAAPPPAPAMAPAAAGPVPPSAAPATGPNAPSMDLSGADLAPRGGGVETLYSEDTEPPASFTPDVAPPPALSQIVQPIKRESTLEAQKNKTLSHIQDKFDNGGSKVFYNSVPTYRTLFGLLQDDVDRIRKGLPPQATRSEMYLILRAKVLDPTSVVRESEVLRYQALQSFANKYRNTINLFKQDYAPSESEILQMHRDLGRMYRDLRDWHVSTQNAARQELINQGIAPEKLVVREEMTMPGVPGTGPSQPKIPAGAKLKYDRATGQPVGYMLNGSPYLLDGTPYKGAK